jgi:bifunctional non-homologous end joining protein LigD
MSSFIPPMLATRLEDPRRLADPRYNAEPKLDGQRAQLHVRAHRTVHAFSRPGRELIRLFGLAWLREIRWPVASTVLDGEAVAGDGSEGIQAVFEARTRPGSPMAFAAFDVLELYGQSVIGEPWMARRKRLEDLLESPPPGVCLVPVADDAPALWDTWVGQGGEGIILKERTSPYRPGVRSPAWLKLKPKLNLDVGRNGRIDGPHPLGRLGRSRDARVPLHASADRRRRGDPPGGARAARSFLGVERLASACSSCAGA